VLPNRVVLFCFRSAIRRSVSFLVFNFPLFTYTHTHIIFTIHALEVVNFAFQIFCVGSYPHAQQFYYATGRGRVDTIVAEDDTADGDSKDEG
jgi:hypothetical protein